MVDDEDYHIIQRDINYLLDWAMRNKMKFHPSKCKVFSVASPTSYSSFFNTLPCVQYFYTMGNSILDYTDSEKDLGIVMNSTLNFNDHANLLYGKANQKLGMIKRNCYFVSDTNRRKVLYLTLVRSIFEHCPSVWRPRSNAVIDRLESLQKRALKWIRNDIGVSYSVEDLYHLHCKQLNILPIRFRFNYHDMKTLHLIVHGFSCVQLPAYLKFYSGSTRLRSSHLDHLSLVSDVNPRGNSQPNSQRGFANSFFYRSHLMWNRLPLALRETIRPSQFKIKLLQYIWSEQVFNSDRMDTENIPELDDSS